MPWTKERISALKTTEIKQLRANALGLGHADVVAVCDAVLGARPKESKPRKTARQHELDGRPLVSRSKAFGMRGAKLRNPRWSWGAVRADGTVIFTVWADSIQTVGTSRRYMLWAPNTNGLRPWSDKQGGQERLRHCGLALARGEAEGVLIYGERRGDDQPLETASKVHGADAHTVLRFKVMQDGDEYWALWDSAKAL